MADEMTYGDSVECSNCGKSINPTAAFCQNCGTQMQAQVAGPASTTPYLAPPPAAPTYGSPPAQQGYVVATPYVMAARNNGLCVAALVLGILSVVFFWIPYLGLVLGLLAMALGGVGMGVISRDPASYTGMGMGIAGLVLGIIGFILNIVILAVIGSLLD